MIINLIDIKHNGERARRITATIAGFMAYNGYNCLVLQFENYTQDSIEKILYYDYRPGEYGMGYKDQSVSGMDALFNETAMNNITKETFYDNVKEFSKSKRFDIAQITNNNGFVEMLDEKQMDVITLLTSADQVYDYVFVSYGSNHPDEVFGAYIGEIMKLVKMNIYTARQGEWVHPRDCVWLDENRRPKGVTLPEEIYIVTEHDPDSMIDLKTCAQRLNMEYKKTYPLAEPLSYRDAADSNKLAPYLKANRNSADDAISDANVWAQNLLAIMSAIGGTLKKVPEDIWGTWEIQQDYTDIPEADGE